MTDVRQLPLFPTQPASPEDLNKLTALRDSISLFQQYLLQEGKSQHTVAAFTSDLQLLAERLGETTQLGKYTTSGLNEFLGWLEFGRGVPCSRKSYARRVTTLKVFFKWLYTIGAIPHDPAKAVLQRSGPAPLAEILTPEEVARVTEFARALRYAEKPDARPEMLFRLIADTGIKKSETMRLTPADIDRMNPQNPILTVRHKDAKNVYKERRIALDPDWLTVFDEYLVQYKLPEMVITCTARNLEYILEDIGKGAGLEKKISFEMLRWTSAVDDYRAGVDPEEIRDKLGLSKISWLETFSKIKLLADRLYREEE